MSNFNHETGKVLRRAGKLTVALQIFSGILLVILLFLYSDISSRQRSLRDGVRENAMWAVYQLDRETGKLAHDVALALTTSDTRQETLKTISRRYDILYSRVDLIRKGRFQDFFVLDSRITKDSGAVREKVLAMDKALTRLWTAKDPLKRITLAHVILKDLEAKTNDLLLTTNERIADKRTESRDTVVQLEHTSAIFLILLSASVVFLIATLRRQLTAVRQAGLGLEAMASDLSNEYHAADAGNRAKSQFMATMGHEIRTPLNAILGTAELMELSNLPPDVHENAQIIRTSGEALLEILNEILDYSKIEYGKLELELRPANISEMAKTVIGIMRGRAAERGNKLVLDMPDALDWPWVETDPTRLRQIVLNLMSNAIKFTDHGTVTLRFREASGPNASRKLRIEVADTGIGIDEEGLEKLFKPFSQVDASISRRYGGTGLGLTISREIAERLGGQMGVESTPGKGSIFWLEIPVRVVAPPESTASPAMPAGMEGLPEGKVLVVEDNKVNQQIALRFLERLGQTCDVVSDGREAVEMATRQHYDFILMDMQMPVMDGIQAARAIRAGGGVNITTPIIAMTANASDDDRRSCQEAGMNGFEGKPITLARLHAALMRFRIKSDHTGSVVAPVKPAQKKSRNAKLLESSASAFASGLDAARKTELVEALGEDAFEELLVSFFNDARDLLGEIAEAMRKGDEGNADKALHTLKGAAANVGFNGVAGLAQQMRSGPVDVRKLETLKTLISDQEHKQAA